MIKDALSVMPTRPIVYIAPLIVLLVLSVYYWDMYSKCTGIKHFRTMLNETLSARDGGSQFRLTEVTGFTWDRVRIVTEFKPEGGGSECPLDWNWPGDERDTLIAKGLLTVLIFVDKGTIVEYLELRSDEVEFRGMDSSLAPRAAVFNVAAGTGGSSGVILNLKR